MADRSWSSSSPSPSLSYCLRISLQLPLRRPPLRFFRFSAQASFMADRSWSSSSPSPFVSYFSISFSRHWERGCSPFSPDRAVSVVNRITLNTANAKIGVLITGFLSVGVLKVSVIRPHGDAARICWKHATPVILTSCGFLCSADGQKSCFFWAVASPGCFVMVLGTSLPGLFPDRTPCT